MKDHLITSVEITDSYVKCLQATVSQNAVTVDCDIKEISKQSDQEISKILSAMFIPAKKPGRLIGVVPRQFAILRHLSLPSHADEEIEKMIHLQITKQVPYPKEDIVLDYKIIEKESSGYSRVLVTAVHKEVIGRYLKIFQDAGLPLDHLTLSSVGLLYWYIYEQANAKEKHARPVALIHIDTNTSEICFCYSDKLLFSRGINSGARDLNGENIMAFLHEIALTISTYTTEKIGADIANIIVVSTMSETVLLKEKLESEYKLPVTVAHPFDGVIQKKDLRLPMTDRVGASFAIGLGLVLGDTEKLVNLLPSEISGQREIRQRRKEWLKCAALFVLTTVLLASVFGVRAYKNLSYLQQLQKKIDETQPAVNKIKEGMKRLEFMQERMYPAVSALDIIHELYALTPPEISFSVLSVDENGSLVLQGTSETGSAVNAFQKNLVDSPLFRKVTLQYVTKRKVFDGELTDFQITCQISKR